jgi:PKD repeat protein
MFKVVSKFATTDIVFANSQGPYLVNGGTPITLTSGIPNANATYAWDLGDGTTASTPSVVHTYGNDGVYLAQLKVKVNQPGGDTSQHFALIHVRNVPPIVNAGPSRVVNEGDVLPFTGSFTDVQWLETHEAIWSWGDSQMPDKGVVTETHNPPTGQGTVTASHAWGDAGIYTVSLNVEDKGGAIGRGQTTVTVLNVPPTVDAGAPMFAYPCCVLTLEGKFTDPGWLDNHAGFWDFGDCTGPQSAVVREEHDPPAGKGIAIASHVYHKCGTYKATCIVIDDDGGVGISSTVIMVVDIRNAGFEEGFCSRQLGVVGNYWEPYIAQVPPTLLGGETFAPPPPSLGGDTFQSEEYCVHHGERSQRIRVVGRSRAGILQKVGANPGWDYQIAVWYSLNEQSGGVSQLLLELDEPADMRPPDTVGGTARLGIDPTGGTDPSSHNVIWANGYLRPEWAQLSVRATATGDAITIFLEGEGAGRLGADVFFDDTALVAVQPFCPEEKPKPPEEKDVCVDFSDLHPGTQMPPDFKKDKFAFVALDGQPQLIVALGPPINQNSLQVHPRGLEIHLPFVADAVRVTVTGPMGGAISVSAFNSMGNLVAQANALPAGTAQTVEVRGPGITMVRVIGKEGVSLIKVCAHRAPQA